MEHSHANEIIDFFSYKTDKLLQARMLQGNCGNWSKDAVSYIHSLINIPIESIIVHIASLKRQPIFASDVFQFSDFEHATTKLCSQINCTENAGLNFIDIGKLLYDDDILRNDAAVRKYGENHIKMAEAIGLAFKNDKAYYLSPLGCVFNELTETDKNKLIVRLILRNKLISQSLLAAQQDVVNMEAFLYDLAKSTYERRKPNIKFVIDILSNSQEYDFSPITRNIIF